MLVFPRVFLIFSNKTLLQTLLVSVVLLIIAYLGYQFEIMEYGRVSSGLTLISSVLVYAGVSLLLKNGKFAYSRYANLLNINAAIIIIGALFKIQHWPFADVLLIIGLFPIPVIYTLYFFTTKKEYSVIAFLKLVFVFTWILWRLFRVEHWPYADELQIASEIALLTILVFFLRKNYTKMQSS
jgi:hypothetical protein